MLSNFKPETETTRRRPTPTAFVHLRKWVTVEEHSINITNITEIKNINEQLEQTAQLFINNIIQRVIAQLVGAYGSGFVTLQATADGALKVASVRDSETSTQTVISFATIATHEVIAAVAGKKIKITNLMLTVAGETNLTLKSNTTGLSGAMDFGGADEPKGMVTGFGDYPLETAVGEAFQITSTGAVQVSGFATYFTE